MVCLKSRHDEEKCSEGLYLSSDSSGDSACCTGACALRRGYLKRPLPSKKPLVFCARLEMPRYGHSLPQKKQQTEEFLGQQLSELRRWGFDAAWHNAHSCSPGHF